jgi:hypothetical protein
MPNKHAEWQTRAAECHEAARAAMQRANDSTNAQTKAEFLKLATELLKLAEDIERFVDTLSAQPLPD